MRSARASAASETFCCCSLGFTGKIAVAMHTPTDTETLYAHGADVILSPFSDAAEFAVTVLEQVLPAGSEAHSAA